MPKKNNNRPAKECQNCKKHLNYPNPQHQCKDWKWGYTCDKFEYESYIKSYNPKKRK